MSTGRIVAVNVSDGGVPKRAVAEAHVHAAGLAGDRQRDLRHHGGPDRAVCLLAQEVIDALAAIGHPIAPGTTGDNLTIVGIDPASLGPGVRLAVGPEVRLEITAAAAPCSNIRASFHDGDVSLLDVRKHAAHARWYARVLAPGRLAPGLAVAPQR
jgi:MOSC domain-containing protein YiiM